MAWYTRLLNLTSGPRLDQRIDDELAFHIAEKVDELVESGISEREANRIAMQQFGNYLLQRERTRDMDVVGWLETVGKDLRYAMRMLLLNPGFTTVAVLTLALGIGANVSLFSVVNALFLRPPSYLEPDRLVVAWESTARGKDTLVSAPNFNDWRERNSVFSDMAMFQMSGFNIVSETEARPVAGARASASLFRLLGVEPLLGRTPTTEEEQTGKDRVVVLSESLWRAHFGGDRAAVGKSIRMNGEPYTVIGVMPAEFHFPTRGSEVWVPIGLNDNDRDRSSHSFQVAARLKPRVSLTQASAEMDRIGKNLAREYPVENQDATVVLVSLPESGTAGFRQIFAALLGAVAFVLLIAAANVANLLLARGESRRREMALRGALGAGAGRMARQLLTESLLLAALGCAAGLLIARLSIRLLATLLPGNVKFVPFRDVELLAIDWRVFLFAVLISFTAALIFGLAPVIQAFRADINEALKQGGRSTSSGSGRLSHSLIAAEVALALVVLTGAGLLARSVAVLLGVDPGLNPANVLTMNIALPQADFYGPPQRPRFCQQIREEVGRLPGIKNVSAVSNLPFTGSDAGRSFKIDGRPEPASLADRPRGSYNIACPEYFRTLGIPLIEGREFSDRDSLAAVQTTVINQAMAKRYWPGESPLGRRIKLGRPTDPTPWLTIIGVAGDTRRWGLDKDARPEFFRPYSQAAWPQMSLVVLSADEPVALGNAVRGAIARIDRELPAVNARTMESVLNASIGPRRFPLLLLGAFALLALILAAVGIFGVVSYLVEQRTQEIGLRVALGAGRQQVLKLVMGRSVPPVILGIVIGLGASLGLGRLLESLLYGVRPIDPLVLLLVSLLLGTVALIAVVVPALRAAAIEPTTALKQG